MYEHELGELAEICAVLREDAAARAVILFDRSGALITSDGELGNLDLTALASLAAAHVAAAQGLAGVVGETFDSMFHEGRTASIYLSLVEGRAILAALYGEGSSLGLLRLRAKGAERELGRVIRTMVDKAQAAGASAGTPATYEGVPGVRRSML